ncbi:MAG: DNA polymerase III subunit gamma/tau [Candidatus Sumerlaeaceae bacterium]|nr:DNA polymerase III subunit gamma/tau [Candidatus Sumerlaeaceae bacterium]
MPRKKKEIEDQPSQQDVSDASGLFFTPAREFDSSTAEESPFRETFSLGSTARREASLSPLDARESDASPGLFSEDQSSAADSATNSSYLVLARRYRPQTFDDIVGQEHVRESLRRAILERQVAHAYLFSGPRGTGKTSTARILAKALNCLENGPRPDPCGRCASCRAIAAGTSLDVIEIDAASNTGVDNIRDLKTGAVLAPFSRYKVYIVDEVHMLSMQAFNALLKTLEEPPPRVIFILATTELHKVPPTIVSRCQCFQFRRFTTYEIVSHLDKIADREAHERGITVDPEEKRQILELIARAAEGGMRDAQVALDQVLVLCRDRLDYETVRRFLGGIQSDVLEQFVQGILERRTQDLLLLLDDLISRGLDLERFVKNLAEFSRNLLLLRQVGEAGSLVDLPPDRVRTVTELANKFSISGLINLCSSMVRLLDSVKASSSPRFLLELEIVKLTRLDPEDDLQKLIAKLKSIERAGITPLPAQPSPSSGPNSVPEKTDDREIKVRDSGSNPTPESRLKTAGIEFQSGQQTSNTPPPVPNPTDTSLDKKSAPADKEVHAPSLVDGPLPLSLLEKLLRLLSLRRPQLARAMNDVGEWELRSDYLIVRIDPSDRYLDGVLRGKSAQPMICGAFCELTGRRVELRVEYLAPAGRNSAASQSPAAANHLKEGLSGHSNAQTSPELVSAPSAEEADEDGETAAGGFAATIDQASREDDGFIDVEAIQRRFQPPLKGEELRRYIDAHPDLGNIVEELKNVFEVDENALSFKRYTLED